MLLTPQPASVAATMRAAKSAVMRLKPWRSMGMAPRSRRELDCVPRTAGDVVIDCGAKRGLLPLPALPRGEGRGEGRLQALEQAAAPHPNPLPILKKNGERGLLIRQLVIGELGAQVLLGDLAGGGHG